MKPGDAPIRFAFADWFLSLTPQQKENFCQSDEAVFELYGGVNTQNVRRYALPKYHGGDGRPEGFIHPKVTCPKKLMVFLGCHSSGKHFGLTIVNTQERERGLDGNWYHTLVSYKCRRDLKAINPQHPDSLTDMIWRQDGAPIHTTNKVMNLLDRMFGKILIN